MSNSSTNFNRLRVAAVIFTILGVALFAYFIYQAGIVEIWNGISRIGWYFLLVLFLYGVKLATRAAAWILSVEPPHKLNWSAAYKGVLISEALNTIIPLGILISGTAKAVAVSKQLPLVVGFSSVAIENLFYSLATQLLIVFGTIAFLVEFQPTGNIQIAGIALITIICATIAAGFLLIVRQWRFVSDALEWLLGIRAEENERSFQNRRKKFFSSLITHPSSLLAATREFENQIFGFYRRQASRFVPIMLLQIAFHGFGVLEVWFILQLVSPQPVSFSAAFMLESINRVILFLFKLIPLALGVDEAGAQIITDNLNIGHNVGVIMTIIRKGRALVWAFIGLIMIARSDFNLRELIADLTPNQSQTAASVEQIKSS